MTFTVHKRLTFFLKKSHLTYLFFSSSCKSLISLVLNLKKITLSMTRTKYFVFDCCVPVIICSSCYRTLLAILNDICGTETLFSASTTFLSSKRYIFTFFRKVMGLQFPWYIIHFCNWMNSRSWDPWNWILCRMNHNCHS
jgi:hypothetical protein